MSLIPSNKIQIFPSDLKRENLAITKEKVFERFFESLNLIVNFITVTINESNPCLSANQSSEHVPVKLLSFVSLQLHLLEYLPALLADVMLHTEN